MVGPGPRARHNWALARACGLETMAKVQFNNTWEISAVPYIPVPHLVLEHCRGLMESGIAGVMASWTCGGYPSPNLDAAQAYYVEPRPSHDQILLQVASRRYGRDRARHAVEAWRIFSGAFQEFPYGVAPYLIPTQHGPANLLRLHPTGHRSGMILFPQDNLADWCGAYPPAAVHQQFSRLAARWKEGLEILRRATAGEDLAIAETCWRHFRSVANQVRFYMLRENSDSAAVAEMRTILRDEIELARRQFLTARRHSVIAYEASNHYYYTPLDLAEKVLNCHQILEELSRRG